MELKLNTAKVKCLLAGLLTLMMTAAASAQVLSVLSIEPPVVAGGTMAVGTMTLNQVTQTPVTINLQSSDSSLVSVPSQAIVPAGSNQCQFNITTKAVTSPGTFLITASQGKVVKTATITLAVDAIKSFTLTPNFVTSGFGVTGTVTLQKGAPVGGWKISVTTDNANSLVPPTVTVPAGQGSVVFPIGTLFSPGSIANIKVKDLAGSTATSQLDINPLQFTTFDGPPSSPTTINGISNKNFPVGFTTQNGVNSNFIFVNNNLFIPLPLTDPAGSLNALNSNALGVGVNNGKAFFETNAVIQYLPIPGAITSVAFGVNDYGFKVGQYTRADGKTPGFVEVNGVITTLIPVPTATVVNAQGINNNGIVVGFYSINGVNQFPFTYNINTKKFTFPANPSTARTATMGLVLTQFLGVNDAGNVCGYYQTNNGSQFGLVYNLASGKYTFYDPPQAAPVNGVQITQLVGISNNEIAGFYIDAAGLMHGLLAK